MDRSILCGVAATACSVASHAPAVTTWDGSCGGTSWNATCPGSQTNWNPLIPGPTDEVTLGRGDPLVTIFGNLGEAASISCVNGLSITNGGQLKLHGIGGTIRNLSLTNSSVMCATAGTILTLQGNCASNGASYFGPGEVHSNEVLTGNSASLKNFPGSGPVTFRNFGDMTVASISFENGTEFFNEFSGFLTLTQMGMLGPTVSGTSGLFHNDGGIITIDNSTPTLCLFSAPLRSSGGVIRIQGSGADTRIDAGAVLDGTLFELSNNKTLTFGTGFSGFYEIGNCSFSGQGNVTVQLGPFPGVEWRVTEETTMNLTGSTGFLMDNGPIGLGARLINTGKAAWKGSTIRPAQCVDCFNVSFRNESSDFTINTLSSSNGVILDTEFINEGIVTQVVGGLTINNNDTFTNNGSYQTIRGNIGGQGFPPTGQFVNNGLFLKLNDPAAEETAVSVPFINTGDVVVQKKLLNFDNGALRLRQGDIFIPDSGDFFTPSHVRLNGGLHLAESGTSRVEGVGDFTVGTSSGLTQLRVEENARLEIMAGSLSVDHLTSFTLPTGGRIGGEGTIHLMDSGVFDWTGGTIGVATAAGPFDADVTNDGWTNLISGTVSGPTSLFTNAPGGFVNHANNCILNLNSGAGAANRGLWRCASSSAGISGFQGVTGTFFNDVGGRFEVQGPLGNFFVSSNAVAFTNRGLVHVISGSLTIPNPTGIVNNRLTEGSWIVNLGGQLIIPGHTVLEIGEDGSLTGNLGSCPNITPVFNAGNLTCNGDWGSPSNFTNEGAFTTDLGTFTCNGDFLNTTASCTVNEGTTVAVGGDFQNIDDSNVQVSGGTCEVEGDFNNGSTTQTPSILSFAGEPAFVPTVAGGPAPKIGFFCENFNNNSGGVIRPGGPLAPGPFHITGDFHQFAGGRIQIELGGRTPVALHDQVIINGNAALGGLVEVSFLPPFTPNLGQQFIILTASGGAVSGQFSQVSGPGLFSLSYSPTAVTLTYNGPLTPGDLDGNDVVNGIDLGILLSQWLTDGTADLNNDSVVNGIDLGILLANWT